MKYGSRKVFLESILFAFSQFCTGYSDTEKGVFQLEARDGRIKELYSSSQFSIWEGELISVAKVPNIDTSFDQLQQLKVVTLDKDLKRLM
ncbi:hypothetical protein TNCV_3173521 [Trichonephila clavipes]|nr:hypothetical protein TNCV_3173521 [Trichonephila clavipes]